MFSRAQPHQIGIDHQALIGVLRCDAADRLANATGIDAIQGDLQGIAPTGCGDEQADDHKEVGDQAVHHGTAGFFEFWLLSVPFAARMVRRSADSW